MAPLGPRLDRPSAAGDEGRPRATSLGLAALVVVAVAVGVGLARGDPGYAGGVALLAGLSVVGMTLQTRTRIRTAVVGHLCFLPAASLLVLVVALSPGHPLVGAGLGAAFVGIAAAWADVGDARTLGTSLASNVVAYATGVVGLVLAAFLSVLALGVWEVLRAVTGDAGPVASVLGLLVVLAGVCASLALALWRLPVVQLAPRDRTGAVARRRARLLRKAVLAAVGCLALAVSGTIFALSGLLGTVLGNWPVRPVVVALTSTVVVAPLVALAGLSIGASVLAVVARRATAEYSELGGRVVAALLGGVGYVAVLALVVVTTGFATGWALLLLVAATFVAPILVYLVLLGAFAAVRLGLVSGRGGAVALAAAGLVAAAVGAAAEGLHSLVVFGAVAGALVVWDAGSFGLGVTAELGHRPETRRLELYHGVFAVGVGLVGVALAAGLDAARRTVGAGIGTPEAMAVTVVGVVVLLLPLRG